MDGDAPNAVLCTRAFAIHLLQQHARSCSAASSHMLHPCQPRRASAACLGANANIQALQSGIQAAEKEGEGGCSAQAGWGEERRGRWLLGTRRLAM